MDFGLKGKSALVTGGSHGIGLAIGLALAEEGVSVHIAARGQHDLVKAVRPFFDLPGKVWAHQFDALEPASVDRLAQEVGPVDILINNVGGGGRWGNAQFPFDTLMEVWDQVYQKNARCAVQLTRTLAPKMVEQGWGRVVTVGSIHGREAGSNPWFMMAKSAEIALMKGLAMGVSPYDYNVTFNTVAPGYIYIEGKDTEASRGTPEDVAHAVLFLCSKQAKHINGACLVVDGGESKAF